MKSDILDKISKSNNYKYIFWVTLLFYLSLLLINPANKLIALSYILLFVAYSWKLKNITLSLVLTSIASSIVFTGKTYPIQLAQPGIFSKEVYPNGYNINFVLTPSHFVAFAMIIYTIRQFVTNHKNILHFKFNALDALLVIYYLLKLFSAIFGSKNIGVSLPLELISLADLVVYLYLRFFIKYSSGLWRNISYLFAALLIFEGVLGFVQLIEKSPLGKNIEYQVGIEYFGHSVDETPFAFRPVGTFEHANALGIWVASICILLFASAVKYKSKYLYLSLTVGIVLLITTISRSAWLGFAFGFVYLFIYILKNKPSLFSRLILSIKRFRYIIFPILIFMIVFFIIPRVQNSLYSFQNNTGAAFFRRIQNEDAMQLIETHPFFGVGNLMTVQEGISLNSYTMNMRLPLEVHNWFLSTALKNGLIALFVYIAIIITLTRKILMFGHRNIFYSSIIAVILGSIVSALFQPYLNETIILLLISQVNSDSMDTTYAKGAL